MEIDITNPMSTYEAGKILKCSATRIGQLLNKGILKGKKFGRQWIVDRDSVEAYRQTVSTRGTRNYELAELFARQAAGLEG